MGKSAAARLLFDGGIAVVDSDQLARQLVEPGQPALTEITQAFGSDLLDVQGHLRREELGRRVFHDPSARQRLEAILHPKIRAAWKNQCAVWAAEDRPVAVVDIPLLFETGAAAEFDWVICVACSSATQQQRLLSRGWPQATIDERLRAQWPIHQKMAQSDCVLWNESSLTILREQIRCVLRARGIDFHA